MVEIRSMTIRRIRVGTAVKLGVGAGVLFWAVFGLLFVGLQYFSLNQAVRFGGSVNGGLLCGIYIVGLIVYPIALGIGAAIWAWAFNVAAGWVGGLQLEVEISGSMREEKPKPGLGTP